MTNREYIKSKIEQFLNELGFENHLRGVGYQTEEWSNEELAEAMATHLFQQLIPTEND
jgi:hypothetical protein